MDPTQLQELNDRIDKLEKRDVQDLLTLLELMSNAYFFGGMKKENCEHARDGQCSLFYLQKEAKNKVPVATGLRSRRRSPRSIPQRSAMVAQESWANYEPFRQDEDCRHESMRCVSVLFLVGGTSAVCLCCPDVPMTLAKR